MKYDILYSSDITNEYRFYPNRNLVQFKYENVKLNLLLFN